MNRVIVCAFVLLCSCSKDKGATEVVSPVAPAPSESTETERDSSEAEAPLKPSTDTESIDPGDHENLQLLPSTWSDEQLMGYMNEITKGLGVKCGHCHEPGDFAADTIPAKQSARKMIEMAQMLDNEYFGGSGRIKCATCHNGSLDL